MSDLCQLLPWDTAFFGLSIGRISNPRATAAELETALVWCRKQSVECLYFLVDGDSLETIRAAESAGFRLVDIRLTLQCDLRRTDTRSLATGLAVTIRAYVPGDLSALQQLARTAHSNSRFFTDPHFDRERSGELYARWIQQNCENPDGHVVVAQVDNVPIGYVSCTVMAGGETGVIGLVGVDDRYRGRGVAAALLRATLQWLCEQNVQQVRVVTQGCNAAAQRIYQRQGFLTERCELWYHKWFSVDRAP